MTKAFNKHLIKLIALDLDGTLTQHKEPLCAANREALMALKEKYKLLMVGAGLVSRIFNQLEQFPIDIIGSYGLQYGVYNSETKSIDLKRNLCYTPDKPSVEARVTLLREKHGYTEFSGKNVDFHPSGCVTFPLPGTVVDQESKLAFDSDRAKRRLFYDEVVTAFPEYCVFVGGSTSFDMAPKPHNKYHALDQYCKEHGLLHENVVFIGDDYGLGGNDESVYLSDFPYITIDDYRTFPERIKPLLEA